MKSPMLPTIVIFVLILLSGCTSNKDFDGDEVVDNQNPTDQTFEPVKYMGFSGKSYSNYTALCVANNCVGLMNWNFGDKFFVYSNTSHAFVTAEWESTTSSEVQQLDIWVFSGDYPGNYEIVARDQGKSPLTLAITEDDLKGHLFGNRTNLGIGFSADSPAQITPEQYIYWDVVVLFS